MAQFVEVMRQARRLCAEQPGIEWCLKCPIQVKGGCMVAANVENVDYEDAEQRIMQWAAEHPETVYPSWDEVWKNLFPGAKKAPCPRTFFGCECMVDIGCAQCGSRPIPAEIAEKLGIIAGKLGIRPKEG